MDWSFLKFNLKVIYLIQNITVAILLQITELLMEPVFICPCNEFRICFVTTYFTVPAAALTAFAVSHQEGKVFIEFSKCRGEKSGSCLQGTFQFVVSSLKILYPAMCWTVILLLDGKYAACGLYSKCNCTMCTVDLKDPELLHDMMRSKLWGFTIIAGFVLFYFIFLLWNCHQSPAYRYERMYLSQLEEDREEFAKEYMKMCSEKRRKVCEKSLSKKTEVNPEAEDTTPPGAISRTPPGAVSMTPSGVESITTPGAQGTTQLEVRRKTGLDLKHTTPPVDRRKTGLDLKHTTPPGAAGGVDPYLENSLKALSEGVDDLIKHEDVKWWDAPENLGEVDPQDVRSPTPPSFSTDHGGVSVLQAAATTFPQSAQPCAASRNFPKQSETAHGDNNEINEEDTETIVYQIKKAFEKPIQSKCKLCCTCTDPSDNSPAPSVNMSSASPETSSTAVLSNNSPTPAGGAEPELRLHTETQDFQKEDVNQPLLGKSNSNQESLV